MVSKVPAKLAGLLKTAIKNGAITIVGERIVSVSIDQLEAPLKEFFNNLPGAVELISDGVADIAEDGYRTVQSIAQEVINEAENIGKTIGHEFEHAGKVVVQEIEEVGKDIEEAGKKVGSFLKGMWSRL